MNHASFAHTRLARAFCGAFGIDKLKPEVFHGQRGIESIQEAWSDLTRSMSALTTAQNVEYYLAYAKAFEVPDRELLFVTIKDSSDRLIAIVPLRQCTRKIFGVRIDYFRFPDIPIPIRDVVIDASRSAKEVLDFLFRSLEHEAGYRWDYMHFREVMAGSALLAGPVAAPESPTIVQRTGHSNLVELSKPDYVANVLSSNARNNLRRNEKKLAKLGEFEYRTVSEFPDLDIAYEHFLTTEAAGWKSIRGGKRAIKLHEDQTRFYHDLMRRLAASGKCHIHILYLNGQPVASDYCVLSGNTAFSLKHGYDETYSEIAPGNLLRAYTIQYYEKSGSIVAIDLVSGWKWQERWRPKQRGVFDIKVFNRKSRGTLLYYLAKSKNKRNKNNNAS